MPYFVYLLKCSDDTLYCGITNDISRRLNQHNDKVASKYTRGRAPVKLLGTIDNLSKSDALKLEYKIKQLKRLDKLIYFGLDSCLYKNKI